MSFYEYHAHPEVDLEGMVKTLEGLGWKGVCLVCKSLEAIDQLKASLAKTRANLDVCFGYKIETTQPEHVPKIARMARKKAEIIMVHGGSLEVNRKACETSEIDVLAHPELGRNDSGLDHVMARLAKENGVAIEFNLRSLLLSYKKTRSDVFSHMLDNAKLVRKYKAPFVLTSGAVEPYDLRSPSEMLSLAKLLGLDLKRAKLSLSAKMLAENRKRLGTKWIMPGVEIE